MKKCPKCNGQQFKAIIKRGALIQIDDNDAVEILKEGVKSFALVPEGLICTNPACGLESTLEELTVKIPCALCGELHEEEGLKDGKCELCILKEQLGSATKEDLFKLILDLQHKAGPVEMKNEKKIEEAEQITQKVEQKNASGPESEEEPTKKKRTSRKSKKKDGEEEVAEEAVEETSAKEIEGEPVPVEEEKTENPLPAATPSEEKPMTPERAEASDVSTKPQGAPVNTLSDIFGEPENSNPEIGEGEVVNTEPPADFVF